MRTLPLYLPCQAHADVTAAAVVEAARKHLKLPASRIVVAEVAEATEVPTMVTLAMNSGVVHELDGAAREDLVQSIAAELGVAREEVEFVESTDKQSGQVRDFAYKALNNTDT